MTERSDKNKALLARLEELSKKYQILQQDLIRQRAEINELKESIEEGAEIKETPTEPIPEKPVEPVRHKQEAITADKQVPTPAPAKSRKRKSNLEEFIGGNLINKVGILVLITGVGIGVKYAIDHDLISPAMRIVLGYIVGFGLLGFGFRLKHKYENFSAVLMSGAMAIFYFISYAVHAYYELIPMWMSFALMAGITVITVYLALNYDMQVIAHIGMVGAYAIPFLFLETNERPEIFFPFMAIINGGILVLSLLKQWKALFYASFLVTWIIFVSWFILYYNPEVHFTLSIVILPIFFMTFYVIFLASKYIKKDKINTDDVLILLANSFILFGFGLGILNGHQTGKELLGAFTLANAVIHGGAFAWLTLQKYPDRILRFLVLGLAILFVTVAIPIELKDNWITITWLAESLILFGYGRIKKVKFIERLSYAAVFVTTWALIITWLSSIDFVKSDSTAALPFQDFDFLTACLVTLVFGFIYWLHKNPAYDKQFDPDDGLRKSFNVLLPIILVSFIYFTFRIEIAECFHQWYARTRVDLSSMSDIPHRYRNGDHDIESFKSLGLMIYTMIIFTGLSFLNIFRIKHKDLGLINMIINGLLLLVVVSAGFQVLGSLRDSFIDQTLSEYYYRGSFHIIIRYVFTAFVALLLWASFKYARQEFLQVNFRIPMDLILYIILLAVASTELIQWLDLVNKAESYKLELSILWGLYAVMLIAVGIWKKKKHLRIMAIVIFSVTLLKVFVYDIAHLDTISKTIVLIILGILLLITSYLYIKYRTVLFGTEDKNKALNQ
jgi:uncharacterized membrane protein